MTVRARLRRLERAAPRPAPLDDWLTERQWLEQFERMSRDGDLAGEPDAERALAEYRAALERAEAAADPPFDPPADFQPNLTDLPRLRLLNWRDRFRFPELAAAWDWLAELVGRLEKGTPPVGEAEFAELAAWFAAHDQVLSSGVVPSGLLDVGDGRRVSSANLRWGIAQGPRAAGSGELAETLRRLRARHGGAPAGGAGP